jgi:hypothetical protein
MIALRPWHLLLLLCLLATLGVVAAVVGGLAVRRKNR